MTYDLHENILGAENILAAAERRGPWTKTGGHDATHHMAYRREPHVFLISGLHDFLLSAGCDLLCCADGYTLNGFVL